MDKKKNSCITGIIVGVVIIFIGLLVQATDISHEGKLVGDSSTRFGANFYTEMYQVTLDTGYAVNNAQKNICKGLESVCNAIGWLIVAVGAFTACHFSKALFDIQVEGDSTAVLPVANAPQNDNPPPVIQTQSVDTTAKSLEGGWQCKCGRVHPEYVSNCSCGTSQREMKQ